MSSYYVGGNIPFVKIEDTESKYIDSVGSFISADGLNHSAAWIVPENSVIFTNGATVGNVAINRIAVATKQGILGIIPRQEVASTEFLYYLLSSNSFQAAVVCRQATGTFATITLKNLNAISVSYPGKREQGHLARLLSALDSLLTLHQREYRTLETG